MTDDGEQPKEESKLCNACSEDLLKDKFSKKQWLAKQRRCKCEYFYVYCIVEVTTYYVLPTVMTRLVFRTRLSQLTDYFLVLFHFVLIVFV